MFILLATLYSSKSFAMEHEFVSPIGWLETENSVKKVKAYIFKIVKKNQDKLNDYSSYNRKIYIEHEYKSFIFLTKVKNIKKLLPIMQHCFNRNSTCSYRRIHDKYSATEIKFTL